ncbi:MAG: polyprenyl synthetase family protein [Frankiaceae bacterium]
MSRLGPPPALTRARDLVAGPLRASVDRLPSPAMRRVAGYHFGWVAPDGTPIEGGGGKYVRPALVLLCAEAVGGAPAVAVPGAVAVELVHNFSLLHDDLMDRDEERHHRRTAWTVFGPAMAVLAGDALLALAEQVLGDVPGEPAREALRHLNAATQELIRGQVDDLSFEERMDVTLDEALAMVGGKTASLMGCSASMGAVLAGADAARAGALGEFGTHIGLAFQLVDDLLGIWGRPEVTGKPVLADLRVRKKSVPVVHALTAGGASSERLAALLAAEEWRDEEEVVLAAKLVEDAGSRDWTQREAVRRLDLAAEALDRASPAPAARAKLIDLARFITDRER